MKKINSQGIIFTFLICFFINTIPIFIGESNSYAQDNLLSIQRKQKELEEKETSLKIEEQRLEILKKEIEEKIRVYSELLRKIEVILNQMEQKKTQDLEYLVKVYETMPPEEAGARLSAIDEIMAAQILKQMKPRRASAIMATMETGKVASITKHLFPDKKKIPIK